MNKSQRSISFNSVSPFRKKSHPLSRIPLSFGNNVELQKRQNYLQFYNSSQDADLSMSNVNKSRNQHEEKRGLNSSKDERENIGVYPKQKSSFNDIYYENLNTNATSGNDSSSRRATSKLSNYSTSNSRGHMKPPLSLNIKQRQSLGDATNCQQNNSSHIKEIHPGQQYQQDTLQLERKNSSQNSLRKLNQLQTHKLPKPTKNNSFLAISGVQSQQSKIKKQTQFVNDFRQEKNQFQVSDQPIQFNPVHISFYHNYHNNNNSIKNNNNNSDSNSNNSRGGQQNLLNINPHVQKGEIKAEKRYSSKENQIIMDKSINKQQSEQQPNQRNANTLQHSQKNSINFISTSSPQKRYKKLQDPDKILKYIEQKEIGFDTTPDILKALNIAQKNTDEQFINKKRQPLAPIPLRCEEPPQQVKSNIRHIQKFDLTFNQIDEKELSKYIKEKEEFLNQVELQRYNERYNLLTEKGEALQKKKSREKKYKQLDREQDSFENLHFSISQLEIIKSDSPVLANSHKPNGRESPRIIISTKQSSFDQKFGAIQPVKKYYKEFDEYSVEQKQLLRTQETSPMNNGYSGKIDKMKKQNEQLSKITNLLHQIQRDDPIF